MVTDRKWLPLLLAAAVFGIGVLLFRGCWNNNWPMRNAAAAGGPVVCFGDSLVAGVGADTPETAYPARLEKLIGRPVASCGLTGYTTADGLNWLREHPDDFRDSLVIVTLGGNDLLGHRPWADTERDLQALFDELHHRGAFVAYTGVSVPLLANHTGEQRSLCRKNGVLFIPNLLGGILGDRTLKADEIHPNAAGYAIVAGRVAATLQGFRGFRKTP